MDSAKIPAGNKKPKKKQVKDELDRIKQAEKKKRRLEKALATSAAIRSELEKKKQQKKEEQQKLDEEGAAIAEAVALHVLLGEDSDDSCRIMLKQDEGLTVWDNSHKYDFVMGARQSPYPRHDMSNYSPEEMGWVADAYGYGRMYNQLADSNMMAPFQSGRPMGTDFHPEYFDEQGWDPAALLAAHAVSSLQIADDTSVDAYVFNRMVRG